MHIFVIWGVRAHLVLLGDYSLLCTQYLLEQCWGIIWESDLPVITPITPGVISRLAKVPVQGRYLIHCTIAPAPVHIFSCSVCQGSHPFGGAYTNLVTVWNNLWCQVPQTVELPDSNSMVPGSCMMSGCDTGNSNS